MPFRFDSLPQFEDIDAMWRIIVGLAALIAFTSLVPKAQQVSEPKQLHREISRNARPTAILSKERQTADSKGSDADWAAVFVSAIALALLWLSFRETQRTANAGIESARQAGKAASAAEASVALQTEAFAKQLRPYLAFKETEEERTASFSRTGGFQVHFKNFGQTPASNVTMLSGKEVRTKPIGWEDVAFDGDAFCYGKIAPGDWRGVDIFFRDLTAEQIGRVISGEATLLYRFKLAYDVSESETDSDDVTLMIDHLGWRAGQTRLASREDRERAGESAEG